MLLTAPCPWHGSTTEQKFLEASLAYQAGKSIVTDEEYDRLKSELRKKNSKVVQQVRSRGFSAAAGAARRFGATLEPFLGPEPLSSADTGV